MAKIGAGGQVEVWRHETDRDVYVVTGKDGKGRALRRRKGIDQTFKVFGRGPVAEMLAVAKATAGVR